MYLKRLEIQGFKSFPDKIRLDFNQGITAVVGPNGSGKSNVSDAVRWVLGEQSVKSLRGSKMEDIIFNGTQNRRPLSFAEVSMVIDNTDGLMPTDFSEITVTRRVYRSGESQFLINGAACRLRDIHELFMDTGIGREGYSIIGQGRIEEILSAKSEDRRLLFEEAAGIVKYKNRKHEAEAKLEREKQNLIRVNDIILELEKQLEPLRAQAEKAKLFLEMAEKQKAVSVNIFLLEVAAAEAALGGMERNMDIVKRDIAMTGEGQGRLKEESEKLKARLLVMEEDLEQSRQELNSLYLDIEKREGDIKLCLQNIEHMEKDMERLLREAAGKEKVAYDKSLDLEGYKARHAGIVLELKAKNEAMESMREEFTALEELLSHSRAMMDKYSGEHIERLRLVSDVGNRLQRMEAMYEKMSERREELNEDKAYNLSRINESEVRIQACKKDIEAEDEEIERLNRELGRLSGDREELSAQWEGLTKEQNGVYKALNETKSRYKLLSELETGYEGYYKSVKTVLQQKKREPESFSGIMGAVAELVSAPAEYETAIETALGGSLQNIVTKTEEDAKAAIEFLKRTNAGRATFLPVSSIRGRGLGNMRERILREDGILGCAGEVVSFEPLYGDIVESLLGRVVIAKNLDCGIAFSRKYKYEYKVVTPEGDLINPGGSLTGGSVNKASSGLLSRGREIQALKEKIEGLTESRDRIAAELDNCHTRLESVTGLIERTKLLVQESQLKKAALAAHITGEEKGLKELILKKEDYETEERQLTEQLHSANREIRALGKERKQIEEEIADILRTMDEKQKAAENDRILREKKAAELTRVQVVISGLKENENSLLENISRVEREIEGLIEESRKLALQRDNVEDETVRKRFEIDDIKKEIEEHEKNAAQVKAERERLAIERDRLKVYEEKVERESVEAIEALARLNGELGRIEMKKEQTEAETRKLYDKMWDEYNITYQAALAYPRLNEELPALQRQEKELRAGIRDLGGVNVGAIEEYSIVKERHGFMKKQRDDILLAEEKLLHIIQELKELMEKRFVQQFGIISQNFGVVFAEMFGGGTAYLKLSDESNILESGIEIISQPPGKALQNMSLFSGGERALTATALLFAILRMKPSPFCILDEIEAALDDANVKRFAGFLKNFAGSTQFIVITHRKGTMEAADVLYGVTMQEQGVSKLVSVKFSEGAEAAV